MQHHRRHLWFGVGTTREQDSIIEAVALQIAQQVNVAVQYDHGNALEFLANICDEGVTDTVIFFVAQDSVNWADFDIERRLQATCWYVLMTEECNMKPTNRSRIPFPACSPEMTVNVLRANVMFYAYINWKGPYRDQNREPRIAFGDTSCL